MEHTFEQAGRVIDKENRLLEQSYESLGSDGPFPTPSLTADANSDLVLANESFDPRELQEGTRAALTKRLVRKAIAFYTAGQVTFNGAVVRVLNVMEGRFSRLHAELSDAVRRIEDRASARFARLGERHELREERFEGRLQVLEDRISAFEADLSEAVASRDADRRRIAELERDLRNPAETASPATSPPATRDSG